MRLRAPGDHLAPGRLTLTTAAYGPDDVRTAAGLIGLARLYQPTWKWHSLTAMMLAACAAMLATTIAEHGGEGACGVEERALRGYLGRRDARPTEGYGKLSLHHLRDVVRST